MKRRLLCVALSGALLSCTDHATDPTDPLATEESTPPEFGGLVLDRLAPAAPMLHRLFSNAGRRKLGHDVVHTHFDLRLGPGEFDVVRVHRVVRERKNGRPIRTRGAVFMTHGASLSFEAIFLNAGTGAPSPATSAAMYLAANGIDVWGMDFAWTLVPRSTADFSFMQDWGVGRDVDHTLAAMSVARLIRGLTGQGFGRLNLLGYSYGVGVAYAAAGRETRQHRLARDIAGIIAVDNAVKYNVESARDAACSAADGIRAQIQAGSFEDASGVLFATVGRLATTAPDESSPIVPGLTNDQAALFAGANTFVLQNPPPAPFFHFVAGIPNEAGIPSGLRYTEPAEWFAFLAFLPPYMPRRARYEVRAAQCAMQDVGIDDHLRDISVPILYLGAAGGIGSLGEFTSSLTASGDATNHTVQLRPADQAIADYGHADLFLAHDAADRIWSRLRQWLVDHDRAAPWWKWWKRAGPRAW